VTIADGNLQYGMSPVAISEALQKTLPQGQSDAKNEDLLEICPVSAQMLDQLKNRFDDNLGRALFIDYGPETTEFGDTLQALKRHEKVDVFSDPGNTDLTARVDFGALTELAHSIDLAVTQPRLTASDEMGELFKAICFQSHGLMVPLGFRDTA